MLLDIYRDQGLEKILIVEKNKSIKDNSITDVNFLKGLSHQRLVDSEHDKLPTGIDKDDVVKRINEQGYYAGTSTVTLREIDIPS